MELTAKEILEKHWEANKASTVLIERKVTTLMLNTSPEIQKKILSTQLFPESK